MTYYQFVQTVEKKVKEEVEENIRVSIHTARKYNGTVRQGLLFSEEGNNVSPTIYLEEYYRQFELGYTVEVITGEILGLYKKIRFGEPWKDEVIRDYEWVKEKIIYRLIHREANKDMLEEMPYIAYLDLAIVFYVLLEVNPYGTATMPVKEEHLELWKVTKEQVYRKACVNTGRLLPYKFQTMHSVIADMTGEKDMEEGAEDTLYILSNRLRSFGASAILYPGCLKMVGEYLGEDYYVLPSSVHETVIVRKSAASGKVFLSAMVKEINETQVDKEEVLSDRTYYYDRAHERLSM